MSIEELKATTYTFFFLNLTPILHYRCGNLKAYSQHGLPSTLNNPEALIQARNTKRHCLTKQAKKNPTLPSTTAPVLLEIPSPFLQTVAMSSQELPYTPGALTNPGGSTSKDSSLTGPSTLPTVPWPDEQSTAELVQLLLATQHEYGAILGRPTSLGPRQRNVGRRQTSHSRPTGSI